MKRFFLGIAAAGLITGSAFAQPGAGGTVNNAVSVWGVNAAGQPCLIAPVAATGTPTCGLPPDPGTYNNLAGPIGIPFTTAAMTGTASTLAVAAPGNGLHNYISELHCVNSSATVGTDVSMLDGASGTNKGTLAAPANFGGHEIPYYPAWRQPTANTEFDVQNVTTGASVICSGVSFAGP